MEFSLKNLKLVESKRELAALPEWKLLINTLNAHSYNTALEDSKFAEVLLGSDALIPDGASIVKACRWLGAKSQPEENRAIVDAINAADPDLLWIGMTAPKQEKWTYAHWPELKIRCHVGTVGAVFDFFAGTVKRAPLWWQNHGLEWLYRLLKEPRRMWRRYVVGNVKFLRNVGRERRGI